MRLSRRQRFSSISTRLKWFFAAHRGEPWLDVRDPEGHQQFLRQSILRLLFRRLEPGDNNGLLVLTVFTLAHAAIQRLGELVNGTAAVESSESEQDQAGSFCHGLSSFWKLARP